MHTTQQIKKRIMEILKWIGIVYLVAATLGFIIFAIIAHGQNETRWVLEAVKGALLWPYWIIKLVF